MSNGIDTFLVVYGPKDKKIDIIYNLNKFDVRTSFYKVGKAMLWAVWLAKVKAGDTTLSDIFKKFSNCPTSIKLNEIHTLCNFVYEAYGLTKRAPFKTRRTDDIISTPHVNLQMLVPSPSGILQHIKRACIQAGYFWKLNEIEPTYLTQLNGVRNHSLWFNRTALARRGCHR